MKTPDFAKNDSFLEWLAILTLTLLFLVMLLIYIPTAFSKQPPAEELPENVIMNCEFPLGDFDFMCHLGVGADETQVINFEAYAQVNGKRDELARFDSYLANYKSRFSELIDIAIREASPEELQENDLKTLKARLKTQLNDILGENIVDEVLMSNYRSFMIQRKI